MNNFNWRSECATFENLKNVFVVINPSDNDNPISNSGSFMRETEVCASTLVDAIALAEELQDKFGGSYIAKLELFDIADIDARTCLFCDNELIVVTEKGGIYDGPILWEKMGQHVPRFYNQRSNNVHGKIKLMKVQKYLKYDADFFNKIENGFFK